MGRGILSTLKIKQKGCCPKKGFCPSWKNLRKGFCQPCKNEREGLYPRCKKHGRDYDHLYKNEQKGLCPGGILSYTRWRLTSSKTLGWITQRCKRWSTSVSGLSSESYIVQKNGNGHKQKHRKWIPTDIGNGHLQKHRKWTPTETPEMDTYRNIGGGHLQKHREWTPTETSEVDTYRNTGNGHLQKHRRWTPTETPETEARTAFKTNCFTV